MQDKEARICKIGSLSTRFGKQGESESADKTQVLIFVPNIVFKYSATLTDETGYRICIFNYTVHWFSVFAIYFNHLGSFKSPDAQCCLYHTIEIIGF